MTASSINIYLEKDSIQFRPSSSSQVVTIQGAITDYHIDIVDAGGLPKKSLNHPESPSISLDLSDLPSGACFLRVKNKSNAAVWMEKMIKL